MNRFGALVGAAIAAVQVVQAEPVALEAGDAEGESSFSSGTHWSDGAAPSSEKDYVVALGDEAGLRTPDLTSGAATFAGGSLAIGETDGAAGVLYLQGGAANRGVTVTIPSLVFANGSLVQTRSDNTVMLLGDCTVQTPATDPFLISGSAGWTVLGLDLSGGKDTAVKLTGTKPWIVDGDNSGFAGQIVVDGALEFCVSQQTTGKTFGDPSAARDDAIVLKNGAGFGMRKRNGDNNFYGLTVSAPTRGVWFDSTSAGFNLRRTCYCDFPIGGDTVKVAGDLNNQGGGRVYFMNAFKAAGLSITGGAFVFGNGSTCPANLPVTVNGGFIGCAEDVTLLLTMKTGYVDVNQSADWTRYGVLTVAPGSTISSSWIQLRVYREHDAVESAQVRPLYPSGLNVPERLPVLRVPTSVKALTRSMFTLKWADSASSQNTQDLTDMDFEIETEGEWQTVYLKRPAAGSVYVDPSSPNPTEPYASWDTAAHDIQTAISYAEAHSSTARGCGIIRVKSGTYDISQELTVTKGFLTLVSDDGNGNRDPEHTILDGGFGAYFTGGVPARTNRILRLRNNGVGRIIDGFTFRHGAYDQKAETGNDNYGGGAICAYVYNRTDTTVANCWFVENWSKGNGGALQFVQSSGFATNCVFIGNRAASGAGAHSWVNTPAAGGQARYVDCAFTNNVATGDGGGVNAQNGGDLIRCDFYNCQGKNSAAYYTSVAKDRFSRTVDCTVNCCTGGTVATVGLVCSNLTVRNSFATGYLLGLGGTTVFSGCTIESNETQGAASALPYLNDVTETGKFTLFDRMTFRGNTGGARLGEFCNCAFRNSLVAGNRFGNWILQIQKGSAGNTYRMDVDNCTFADNRVGNSELTQEATEADATVNFRNTIFADGDKSWGGALGARKFTIANCCLERSAVSGDDYVITDTTFETRAKFADDGSGDYRLKRSARQRDAGRKLEWMTESSVDLDGLPRVVTNGKTLAEDPNALPDIGCYENQALAPGLMLLLR